MKFCISTFYKFSPIAPHRLDSISKDIADLADQLDVLGLVILGPEGCNATVSGAPESIASFKNWLSLQPELGTLLYKDAEANEQPFRRFKVDRREEIVTLKRPDLMPSKRKNNHLSPSEWHETLTSGEEIWLVDTRNDYETKIGKFRNAVDPKISEFSEFPAFVKNSGVPKDQKVLMYCTGGIRCEKAILFMQEAGYSNVFQLDGGILNYLAHYPAGEFEGECFVFDHRVAVDGDLKPSQRYSLCPHCGNPADTRISCSRCAKFAIVCEECLKESSRAACSKDCAYHLGAQAAKVSENASATSGKSVKNPPTPNQI